MTFSVVLPGMLFWGYSKTRFPLVDLQFLKFLKPWTTMPPSLRSRFMPVWTLHEALDLLHVLHDFMHCTDATWLAEWVINKQVYRCFILNMLADKCPSLRSLHIQGCTSSFPSFYALPLNLAHRHKTLQYGRRLTAVTLIHRKPRPRHKAGLHLPPFFAPRNIVTSLFLGHLNLN